MADEDRAFLFPSPEIPSVQGQTVSRLEVNVQRSILLNLRVIDKFFGGTEKKVYGSERKMGAACKECTKDEKKGQNNSFQNRLDTDQI